MSPISQGPELPPFRFPYRFGVAHYALQTKRTIDPHSWLPGDDGGVSVGPILSCIPVAQEYQADCVFPNPIKSNPVNGLRESIEAKPRFFEIALQESTLSCPELEELAKQSLLATIEHAIESEFLEELLLAAPAPISTESSYLCAISAAVKQAGSSTNADGRALIVAPPSLLAYGLGTHLLSINDADQLVDPWGNVYLSLKGPNNVERLWVVEQAYLELFLSAVDIDALSYPKDKQRQENTIIVRGEQAYIFARSLDCGVIAVDFSCS